MKTELYSESLAKISRDHFICGSAPIGSSPKIIFREGKGVVLKDVNDNEYLDFSSGLANVNVGHGRKELAEAAMQQMSALGFSPALRDITHVASIECAQRLSEILPEGLNRVYFCCTGSEATECSFKLARMYWRNMGKNKYKVISLFNSFHGLTYGTLSATGWGNGTMTRNLEPVLSGFKRIPNYNCYRCSFGLEYPDCDTICARFLSETIEKEDAESIAAFIAEPIQGPGGFICPPPTYWPIVRKICTDHDILLIADEVMSGFGRSGKFFALEHWAVTPDIMAIGKGITSGYIPLSGMAVVDSVLDGLTEAGFPNISTYSAHPVSCAVASKNIDIIVQENLVDNSAKMGRYIKERLISELIDYKHVGNVNGMGLMCGIEFVADKRTKAKFSPEKGVGEKVFMSARDKGIILRRYEDWVGFAPPLTVTQKEADRAIDTVKSIAADMEALLD
jgi:adenosylmethionine-8-amino-7-oxononanoate aminotransferase